MEKPVSRCHVVQTRSFQVSEKQAVWLAAAKYQIQSYLGIFE